MNGRTFVVRWSRLWPIVWASFFLLLPVTSMPLIVRLVGSDVVAAPSGLIAGVLLIGWLFPRWLNGRLKFASTAAPIFLFALVAVVLTFARFPGSEGVFYKNASPLRSALNASLTLAIGLIFFLTAMAYCQTPDRIRAAMRWINWSGVIVLIWTLLQAAFWYTRQGYPGWMRQAQSVFSVGTLFRQRFVGFTLEPSWLAHQLNLLYLPWWLAATVQGTTAHDWRRGRMTIETILLGLGAVVLYLTLSRVGLAAFALVLSALAIGRSSFSSGRVPDPAARRRRRLRVLALIVLLPAVGFLVLWTLTRLDYRMRELFTLNLSGRSDAAAYLAEKLSLASRFVYWEAGWNVFSEKPIMGAGLGQAGFYIPDVLSPTALRLVEVRDLLFRSETLLNIKSFWIRLLAETGVIGFALFASWLISSFAAARRLSRNAAPILRSVGLAACFTLIAFLIEGFSVDTFALPYLWVSVGISAGASLAARPALDRRDDA